MKTKKQKLMQVCFITLSKIVCDPSIDSHQNVMAHKNFTYKLSIVIL